MPTDDLEAALDRLIRQAVRKELEVLLPELLKQHLHPPRLPKPSYSISEAARVVGVSRNTMYTIAHAGQIASIRVGNRFLIPARALEEFLGEHDHKPRHKSQAG